MESQCSARGPYYAVVRTEYPLRTALWFTQLTRLQPEPNQPGD